MGIIYRAVSNAIRDEMPRAIKDAWYDLTNKKFIDVSYQYSKEKLLPKKVARISIGYAKAMSKGELPDVSKMEVEEVEQWRYRKIKVEEDVHQKINPIAQEVIKEDRFQVSREIVQESDKPIYLHRD